MEELRAELASASIAGELGIPADIPQHASYIADLAEAAEAGQSAGFSEPQTRRGS